MNKSKFKFVLKKYRNTLTYWYNWFEKKQNTYSQSCSVNSSTGKLATESSSVFGILEPRVLFKHVSMPSFFSCRQSGPFSAQNTTKEYNVLSYTSRSNQILTGQSISTLKAHKGLEFVQNLHGLVQGGFFAFIHALSGDGSDIVETTVHVGPFVTIFGENFVHWSSGFGFF